MHSSSSNLCNNNSPHCNRKKTLTKASTCWLFNQLIIQLSNGSQRNTDPTHVSYTTSSGLREARRVKHLRGKVFLKHEGEETWNITWKSCRTISPLCWFKLLSLRWPHLTIFRRADLIIFYQHHPASSEVEIGANVDICLWGQEVTNGSYRLQMKPAEVSCAGKHHSFHARDKDSWQKQTHKLVWCR